MNHYETLGVARDADEATIKAAFRRRAAETHPDRAGGSTEAFQAVQKAWEILQDPVRRSAYDDGRDPNQKAPLDRGRDLLAQVIGQALDSGFADNVVEVVRGALIDAGQQLDIGDRQAKSKRTRLEALRGKVEVKGERPNLVAALLEKRLADLDAQLKVNAERRETLAAAMGELAHYEQVRVKALGPAVIYTGVGA